jgi:peptide/nickel transport system permease protein
MAISNQPLAPEPSTVPSLAPDRWERLGDIWYALRRNPTTLVGLCIVLTVALLGLLAPLIAPYGPTEKNFAATSVPPGTEGYWLGTDQFGHDILSRLLYGAQLDMLIAVSAVATSLLIGSFLGAIAGYVGRKTDEITMRAMDVMQAFPRFIFAMGVAYALGPGLLTVIIATATLNIPGYARLMRGEILSLKESQFSQAAIAVGNPSWRVLFRHLLPNSLGPILVMSTLQCGWAILEAAGLSFIGLGVPVPTAEWGVMINMGLQDFLAGHWWSYTFPGLAIAITVLGFNLLGDGLEDILDPRRT